MEPILQGLSISVVGLLITFLSLGLFILVIVILKALFAAKEESKKIPELIEKTNIMSSVDEGTAAAIAVALQIVQTRRRSQLGKLLLKPRRPPVNMMTDSPPLPRRLGMPGKEGNRYGQ